eukprot:gb/GEZN01007824.1/.p2 GENE.gb/GEZN01007824.1/~~gb/GEZN01007824.1/.p2  ORF type:complete len:195 (+),score=34.21 gb/GEZN01007824.1/:551-1135(+)
MGKFYRCYSNTSKSPRRPFEKERIDNELKLVGQYGLRNKREVWRVQYMLSKVRSVARTLLTLPEKNPRRVFEGAALLRRLTRLGLLSETEQKLDYCLSLTINKFLERRLQTRVHSLFLAKSIHHARVMIRQRHIRVGKRMVNVPSFMVRLESEKHIDYSATSPKGTGRPGRVKRKSLKNKKGGEEGGEEAEEDV